MHRPTLRRFGAAALLAALSGSLPSATGPALAGGGPVTHDFPSAACPKADGLQDCVDAAAPGDIIHLVAEILDDESAVIAKSLTITGSGPKPFPRLRGLLVGDGGPASRVDVMIRDVRLLAGVGVRLLEGQDHEVVVDRVSVGGDDESSITVITDVPADVTLRRSRLHGAELDQAPVVQLSAHDPDGPVRFRLVGNTIEARGDPDSGSGVELSADGDGEVEATLHNNVIHQTGSCICGALGGISILPQGGIRMAVDVVGNTIHGAKGAGVAQRNDLDAGGQVRMRVFGNVFSRVQLGIRLSSGLPGTLVYQGGYNDVWKSGGVSLEGRSAGPGNLAVDPRFVKPAAFDLRLRADSPLVDRMPFCPPTGVENLDAAGKGRLAGARVDLGAFERGASAPTGVARTGGPGSDSLVGTSGADILCGLGGADGLAGLGGRDVLDGGPGDDDLFGNGGADRLLGGSGKDTLCAKDGIRRNDRIDGGAGFDGGQSDPGDTRLRIETGADCSPT